MTTAQLDERGGAETDRIIDWRFDSLVRAGYSRRDAAVLARHLEADLHLAIDLVTRGCPPEVATRIVL